MPKIALTAAATAAMLLASAASATIYRGERVYGGGLTGALQITTDGTLGILGQANILELKLTLSGLGDDAENYGEHPVIMSDAWNPVVLLGTSLTATQGKLLFDFDAGGGYFGVVNGPYYVLNADDCGFCQFGQEFLELDPEFGFWRSQNGVQVLGLVPEPASWAMMITGFGLVGATLRRRRGTVAAEAEADYHAAKQGLDTVASLKPDSRRKNRDASSCQNAGSSGALLAG